MTEIDISEEAQDLHDDLPDDVGLSVEEIEDQLSTLVGDYNVPLEEARHSVVSNHTDESDTEMESENEEVDAAEVASEGEWVNLTAKVIDLWDPRSDSIGQVGLLGDESGRIKFTAWAKSDLPKLEEGEAYRFEDVVTNEYEGRYSVQLNERTTVEQVDEGIEVGDDDVEIVGALVDIQDGSGLINRCPQEGCTRVLQNGRCSEHGEVDGDFDLRIKAVLDDGESVQKAIFDEEMTEEVTGISLDEAEEKAMDALDKSVVTDEIRDQLLGRYYRVKGPVMGRNLLVNEVEEANEMDDPEEILIKARSMDA
ncbi:replication factor A [Halorhabdus rudnickae]|uniref:replication factor A n=1 Tax=Halorhabdus rudnickae TaxID=1775544 RepID=UPI0010837221|nr:replication factor A [Halorhabdus rudnickae]